LNTPDALTEPGGSVRDAAGRVGVRPSTVKRHLADLRRVRGSPLSSWSTRGGPRAGWWCRALNSPAPPAPSAPRPASSSGGRHMRGAGN